MTGNNYQYGKLTLYTGQEGIDLSSGLGGMNAYNTAGALTNSAGTTAKYLCTIGASTGYCGIALSRYDSTYGRVVKVQTLSRVSVDADDFYLFGGIWYAETGGTEYRVSDPVQIHLSDPDLWLSGEEGLASVLADGYDLTLYCDRTADTGGQVRIVKAERAS